MRIHDQTLFLSLFDYNDQTGTLTWKNTNIEVGWFQYGYRALEIDNVKYRAHHVIWMMKTGAWPIGKVDHKDRNGLNNKWDNLRLASDTENARNKSIHNNNTSGYTGVSWNKNKKKWLAHITVNYKTIVIGRFDNIDDAVKARKAKEKELFGEFARKD